MKRFLFPLLIAACLVIPATYAADLIRVESTPFGNLDNGEAVTQFTLRNTNGLTVKLITYGAIITEIQAPDRNGTFRNVIAGSDSLADYLGRFPAAAVIGRFANRIKNGSFEIDGQSHQVTLNARAHHIHGGNKGFAKVNWSATPHPAENNEASVTFSYYSIEGEEGYPGNLTASVTYSLNDRNELTLAYRAETDKPTIVNLTNHAYFNLANQGGFEDHVLWLDADKYTLADSDLIPTGKIAPVSNTPFDFTVPQTIGFRLDKIGAPHPGKYDDNYVLRGGGKQLVVAARLHEPKSGRFMEVRTDQPGVQLYTGNPRGVCLETQHFPDSVNHPHFPSPIVRPGQPFQSVTQFVFSIQ